MSCKAIAKSTGRRCQNEAGEDGYCHIDSHGGGQGGRSTKRTAETARKILDALIDGNTHKTACALAGVSHTFFYEWVKDDNEFSDSVKEAEAEAEKYHVQQIKAASAHTWQASAWMLERRNPKDWAKRDHLDVTSQGDKVGDVRVTIVRPDHDA